MKNKGKKIIKGIAVGAVACLSVGLLAGCEMSEADIEKYDNEIVEAKELLQTQIDELKKQNDALTSQNAELEEQNSALEELNETLKLEGLKITKEQAYDMIQLSLAKLEVNYNGIRDNLKMSMIANDGEQEINFYKTENYGNVIGGYWLDYDETGEKGEALSYELNGNLWEYRHEIQDGELHESKEICEYDKSAEGSMDLWELFGTMNEIESADEIKMVEITPEGNYKITASSRTELEDTEGCITRYSEYTLTTDGKILSIKIDNMYDENTDEQENYYEIINALVTFEYGGVTEEFINEKLQYAINFTETNE